MSYQPMPSTSNKSTCIRGRIMAHNIVAEKTCRACGSTKHTSEFYRHKDMSDGYLNHCKNCVKNRIKCYREKNIEKARAYDRARGSRVSSEKARALYAENREKVLAYKQKWADANAHKRRAQIAAGNAIRDGKIKKMPCVVCGDKKSQAHHDDYDKPLDVVFLCSKHHGERHRQINALMRGEISQLANYGDMA